MGQRPLVDLKHLVFFKKFGVFSLKLEVFSVVVIIRIELESELLDILE